MTATAPFVLQSNEHSFVYGAAFVAFICAVIYKVRLPFSVDY